MSVGSVIETDAADVLVLDVTPLSGASVVVSGAVVGAAVVSGVTGTVVGVSTAPPAAFVLPIKGRWEKPIQLGSHSR